MSWGTYEDKIRNKPSRSEYLKSKMELVTFDGISIVFFEFLRRHPYSEETQRQCPKLSSYSSSYSNLELMTEVLDYRDNMLKERFSENYQYDYLKKIIINPDDDNFYVGEHRYNFKEIMEIYYRDYPEQKPNRNNNLMMINFRSLDLKLDSLDRKLKTMEQFQAQILDKLTVFADMIDGIQKQIEVSKQKPPSYHPESLSLDD